MSLFESAQLNLIEGKYSIRQREADDSQALYELLCQPLCKRGMVSDPFTSAAHFRSWIDSAGPNKFEIVATNENAVAGFAGLFLCGENRKHVGSVTLFVHDQFQSRGIGASLLRTVVAAADRVFSLRRVELTVICENHRAIGLYRRFGFEIEGRHDCFARRGGEYIDVYTMSRVVERLTSVKDVFTNPQQTFDQAAA
jgi:L-phenylalanine/L-methionine N-acetyltransferase